MGIDREFSHRYGPWALVTGASSGIGRALATEVAARGCNVLAVARRADRLQELAGSLKERYGVEIEPLPLDLSSPDFLPPLLEACRERDLGLVACNAGLGLKGLHHQSDRKQIEAVIAVNCTAVALTAQALLPRLLERGRGGLLLTGSIEAYVGFPHSATYSASKAFVRALGEAIWGETRGSGVDVLVLAPGATDTEILSAQGIDRNNVSGVMSPEVVARAALDRLARGPHFVPGIQNKLMVGAMGVVPRSVAVRLAGQGMRAALSTK